LFAYHLESSLRGTRRGEKKKGGERWGILTLDEFAVDLRAHQYDRVECYTRAEPVERGEKKEEETTFMNRISFVSTPRRRSGGEGLPPAICFIPKKKKEREKNNASESCQAAPCETRSAPSLNLKRSRKKNPPPPHPPPKKEKEKGERQKAAPASPFPALRSFETRPPNTGYIRGEKGKKREESERLTYCFLIFSVGGRRREGRWERGMFTFSTPPKDRRCLSY